MAEKPAGLFALPVFAFAGTGQDVLRVCVQNQSLQIPIFKNAKKQLSGEL